MTATTPRYCIANVPWPGGFSSQWAVETDGETIRLLAPDSLGPGASQVHTLTYDEFRSMTAFVYQHETGPEPTCRWAPYYHFAPMTVRLRIARPCGHEGTFTPSCDDHAAAHPLGSVAERETTCGVCGAVNALTVTEFVRLGTVTP